MVILVSITTKMETAIQQKLEIFNLQRVLHRIYYQAQYM